MDVSIITATPDPIAIVSRSAGTSYGKDDVSIKRMETCFKSGHMSVFEHISATFKVGGISRACSHQLVRHRLASYTQKSQRYTQVSGRSWYVTPPTLDSLQLQYFENAMADAKRNYDSLINWGVKPEDARFVLPEATKTEIAITMNFRELTHFFDERCSKAAQWEIRNLAQLMKETLKQYDSDWAVIVGMYEGGAER